MKRWAKADFTGVKSSPELLKYLQIGSHPNQTERSPNFSIENANRRRGLTQGLSVRAPSSYVLLQITCVAAFSCPQLFAYRYGGCDYLYEFADHVQASPYGDDVLGSNRCPSVA